MSCKTPILRAVFDSPTVQAVDADGIINLPEVTSNTECATSTGGTITLRTPGTYEIHLNVTAVATAAGAVEVQMFRNGTAVPGAHAIGTAAAVGDNVPLSFTGLATIECCGSESISFHAVTATSIRVANATIEEVN